MNNHYQTYITLHDFENHFFNGFTFLISSTNLSSFFILTNYFLYHSLIFYHILQLNFPFYIFSDFNFTQKENIVN